MLEANMNKATVWILTGYGGFEVPGVFSYVSGTNTLSLFDKKDILLAEFSDVKCFGQKKCLKIPNAVIAQQVEPSICNREVVGSSPINGSKTDRMCENMVKTYLGMTCCHHSSSYDFEQQTCAACRDGGYNR